MLNKNQVIKLQCTGYTHDGLGVGKYEGFPVFVKGFVRDQVANVVITKMKKNLAFGSIVDIVLESDNHQDYECSVYNECGGCHIGHMSKTEQRFFKTDKVRSAFDRIAKQDINVHDCLVMEVPYRYRNKVAVPIKNIDGELKAGFYKPRSHDLVSFDDCLVQTKNSNQIIKIAIKLFNEFGITAYDEKKLSGQVRHIIIREGFVSKETMVCLVVNEDLVNQDEFVRSFVEAAKIDSLILSKNDRRTSVILGDSFKTLYGKEYIEDYINDVRFKISAKSFYQINQAQTEVLYNKAIEIADLKETDVVMDAYCGIGSIALNLANKVQKVVGIEVVDRAIIDAKENAKLNNITNCEFYTGDVSEVAPTLNVSYDKVFVDPPRKGCSTEFLDYIGNDLKVKEIIYISCDVATQARDVAYLRNLGYTTNEVYPVDLFPNTHHVETVLKLNRI